MSRNTIDRQLERLPITELANLHRDESRLQTTQQQGSSAVRLAVVSGYIKHTMLLDDPDYLYYDWVDIAAPDGANILVGSLSYSAFRVEYNPSFPTDPATITPMDTDNTGWGGTMYSVWLTASLGTDDDDYTAVTSLSNLTDNAMPQNRIRIGSRVYLRQGMGTTSTVEVWVLYQVRMTMGWN